MSIKDNNIAITNRTIAVVDDEPDILELVSVNLERNGFNPVGFNHANELYNYLQNEIPALIILDLMLPDIDGFQICEYLKNHSNYSNIPVIMLTARSAVEDTVTGLEIGADDYITKPFSPRELIARIKTVLRRGNNHDYSQNINSNILEISDDFKIDINKFEVVYKKKTIILTKTEFHILQMLTARPGWVFSRQQILNNLGINEKGVIDRTVDVHIKNLREKLGEPGRFIKNIRGIGYKLEI